MPTSNKTDGEANVLATISSMTTTDRDIAKRLHKIIKANGPSLLPRTWYGMPAYSKDGKVICFFRDRKKFGERYITFGFNDIAKLDDGAMWPIYFAIKELTDAEEKKISQLIKKAVS